MTKLKAIRQRIGGTLVHKGDQTALILRALKADLEATDVIYLRYAFVVKGPEQHIFPAFLLDDWGREVRGLKLYRWVSENGERFPRGEIFGFERDGQETQCFLRELELYARLPCYAYSDLNAAVETGRLVQAILIPDVDCKVAEHIKRPSLFKRPLRAARVNWWRVPPQTTSFDFSLLTTPPNPDY